jgi:hypothetical protein
LVVRRCWALTKHSPTLPIPTLRIRTLRIGTRLTRPLVAMVRAHRVFKVGVRTAPEPRVVGLVVHVFGAAEPVAETGVARVTAARVTAFEDGVVVAWDGGGRLRAVAEVASHGGRVVVNWRRREPAGPQERGDGQT